MQQCPFCGSADLIHSASRGDTVCGNPACGEVLEEKAMVAETTFVTTGSGSIAAAGQRVMWSGLNSYSAGAAAHSHELSLARGVTKIRWISDRLNLNSQIQEAGRRMYQLAVHLDFTLGRSTKFVACACLYMVCRRNRSPHLLIDFSDVVQTPVKMLGQVYMRLLKRLVGGRPEQQQAISDGVDVPLIDPSIFIERYARKLDLGGKQRKVQNTAMRVIKFMHRDWICTGRRPNGLCGAALLIASFYHGLKCDARDIADVVRMTEGTLKIRLIEMRQTPMGLMSRAEFEQANPDAEVLEDDRRAEPPCMLRRKRAFALARLTDQAKMPELTDGEAKVQPPPLQGGSAAQAEIEGSDAGRKKRKRLKPVLPPVPRYSASSTASSTSSSTASAEITETPVSQSMAAPASQSIAASSGQQGSTAKHALLEPSGNDIEEIASDITNKLLQADDAPLHEGSSGEDWQKTASLTAGRIAELDKQGPDFDDMLLLPHSSSSAGDALSESGQSTQSGVEESMDDVDDTELLELYLLNEEEKQDKANIWQEVNKDYLEEWHERQKEKLRRQQRESESSKNDSASETGSRTSSKRSSSRRSYPSAETPVHSAMMALTKKAKVRPDRINMKALENLFDTS
mmetsp:Transcript_143930/g.250816  ORF Transcript_143930/g.250816 Transcript_143930/m.250816 type:complete len:628 (+) Transcript_143930:97-1980(+)